VLDSQPTLAAGGLHPATTLLGRVAAMIPRGMMLDDDTFRFRHRAMVVLLWSHLPVLGLWAVIGGKLSLPVDSGLLIVLVGALAGTFFTGRESRSMGTALGLMAAAATVVTLGGGLTDLHFYFFVLVAVVALYQAWPPFLTAVGFVAVHHLTMGLLDPKDVFSDNSVRHHPLLAVLLHAGFLLALCVALAVSWRLTERAEAQRGEALRRANADEQARLRSAAELAVVQQEASRQREAELVHQAEASARLSETSATLTDSASRVSDRLRGADRALDDLLGAIAHVNASATAAAELAETADRQAHHSADTVATLAEAGREITSIAGNIAAIAKQTNLLALNAMIEAVRAGDAGSGFAVVAVEVKDLAMRTSAATDRIGQVASSIVAETAATAEAMSRIVSVMSSVVSAQQEISGSAVEQNRAGMDIKSTMTGMVDESVSIADTLAALAGPA